MFIFTIDDIFTWGLVALALLVLVVVSIFNAIGGAIQRFSDKRNKRAEEALESRAEKPTLCDGCERRRECKSKVEITMLRDDLRRFMPPFEGCEMTIKNKNLPRKCGDCKYACFLDVLRCEVLGRVQGDWHIVSEDTLYEDCPLKDARGAGFPDRPKYASGANQP